MDFEYKASFNYADVTISNDGDPGDPHAVFLGARSNVLDNDEVFVAIPGDKIEEFIQAVRIASGAVELDYV